MIDAGRLVEEVTIQSLTETRDSYGGVTQAWATFASVWARVVTSKGDEAIRAVAEQAQRTVRFQVRWLSGVLPSMRIVWQSKNYDIREVDDSLRHRGELWITATARMD